MEGQDIDVMKQYFSAEAWEQWKQHYDSWPPEEWRTLFRDIIAAVDTAPSGPVAQALVDRWMALFDRGTPPGSIRTGQIKAWADREHWPPSLKRRLHEYGVERAIRFIGEAAWERWEQQRLERLRAGDPAPPRVTESRRALYHDCSLLLGSDPSGKEARSIVTRWRALLDAETGGDEEIKRDVLDAFSRRRKWPDGMRRYTASLYELDVDTWQRVTDFIERAAASAPLP
jgi:hypothetical protein